MNEMFADVAVWAFWWLLSGGLLFGGIGLFFTWQDQMTQRKERA